MYVKGTLDELRALGYEVNRAKIRTYQRPETLCFKDKDVWFRGIVDLAIVDTLGSEHGL